ncbi:serine/threonine-protein kinase [Streptomyces sp. NPDC059534]|uniref:serine/threonine-protein kinase n=1 Tax=Streptomyces sp. NPDC059534 TaxID=3346859 RepID=UPI0036CF013B
MTVIAGRYRLLDVLAEGATGTVWRALDETRLHEVALKELRLPDGVPADDIPLLYARREREARAAARLSHPAVVKVHGVATEDGRPWIVMELVRGLTLAETLEAGGALPPREAARVGAEVLGALRAARDAGVPHRGVTPGHVLLGNDGRVVVTGFGAGTPQAGARGGSGSASEDTADLRSLGALLDAAAGGRTGPLGALIDELLDTGADTPPAAERVEGELRRLAGRTASPLPPGRPGSGATGDGRTGRSGRTEHSAGGGPGRGAAGASTNGPGREAVGDSGREAVGDSGRRAPRAGAGRGGTRAGGPRRGPVLVAGLVGALLIAGALTYHAVRDDGPGAGPGPGGVTGTAPAGPGVTGAGGGSATPRS